MVAINPVVAKVTQDIIERSMESRAEYLADMAEQKLELESIKRQKQEMGQNGAGSGCGSLGCGNLAHAHGRDFENAEAFLQKINKPNIGIVTSHNDMLSSGEPLKDIPDRLEGFAKKLGAKVQIAGGTPGMCDGITQGRAGMKASLLSREVIAQSTAIGLLHQVFDGALLLGDCDKIGPGLVMGALEFALPAIIIGSGPMSTGISNGEKNAVRMRAKEGNATIREQLDVEFKSYGRRGVCTFFGTANTNNMVMEALGIHVPGSAFVPADDPLRVALEQRAVELLLQNRTPLGETLDEKSFVNAIVSVLATGGSTNLMIHLIAMAQVAGIQITLDDFDALSNVTPRLANVYPNGAGDVNQFHAAGGSQFVIDQLINAGLMHKDVKTVTGGDLGDFTKVPALENGELVYRDVQKESGDKNILRTVDEPFSSTGGLRTVKGDIGGHPILGVTKISAVHPNYHTVEATVRVFDHEERVEDAFRAGELDRDVIVILRGQGPRSNGMPELHKVVNTLTVARNRGHAENRQIALITDGRLSGASGALPAIIHAEPEATSFDSWLCKIRDGDRLRVDVAKGSVDFLGDVAEFEAREPAIYEVGKKLNIPGRQALMPSLQAMRPASQGATTRRAYASVPANPYANGRPFHVLAA